MEQELYMPLNQARKEVPTQKKPHPATMWRWSTRGVRGVVLETMMIGGQRCTTRNAIDKFLRDVTAAANVGAPVTPSCSQLDELCSQEGI